MRARFTRRRSTFAVSLLLVASAATPLGCSSSSDDTTQGSTTPTGGAAGASGAAGTTSAGGAAGAAGQAGSTGGSAAGASGASTAGSGGSAGADDLGPQPLPGESCPNLNDASFVTMQFSPSQVWVAPGKKRTVTLSVGPDFCQRVPVTITLASASSSPADTATITTVGGAFPSSTPGVNQVGTLDWKNPSITFDVQGDAIGTATITASLAIAGGTAMATLPIDVGDPTIASCTGTVNGMVTPGGTVGGTADLGYATLGLQAGADMPATTSEVQSDGTTINYATPILWSVNAFAGSVSCSADIVPMGFMKLGNAVTFGPAGTSFRREIPMQIPIDPAAFPDAARLRHLRVAYSGPSFQAPRTIPVADPQIVTNGNGGWLLSFLAPRLGTYQAVMAPDAGTHTFKRHLTHRAVLGVSMGGGGTSIFGLNHHDKFDVLAPLGGPVDWSWMLDHIEHNHIAGFAINDGTNVPSGDGSVPMATPKNPYEHPSTYNQWWYEYPKTGNGGTFARSDYTQIFRDLAIMYGNPNSENADPAAFDLPRGVPVTDKSVTGLHSGDQCHIYVDPIDGDPNEPAQQEIWNNCPTERCANPLTLHNYYDDEFNPKGTFPVITVCDGGPQDKTKSPYSNQFSVPTAPQPLSVALAVDYNGNGVRDPNEPIIRSGHEAWRDFGDDGIASKDEAGYMAGVNDDPAGDDYQAQYNPNGTEGNARHEMGEEFDDFGLDGVNSTPTAGKPFDLGEGDGKFTAAAGLQRFWDLDSRTILHQQIAPAGGMLDDAALQRLDIWVDGGTRDLFNFEVAAQHLMGSFSGRNRDAAYYTGFGNIPGQDKTSSDFDHSKTDWNDVPGGVLFRYGPIDATKTDLDDGSGQHVGTGNEIIQRLEAGFYFIEQRWPDASRVHVDNSKSDPVPGVDQCQIIGSCDFNFTDSVGRTGPVTVSLPPGYANVNQQSVTYPVTFVLHGYGQDPTDLAPAVVILANWMNDSSNSSANRIPKAITVYVDGRCRTGATGTPECIRGSFYGNSPDMTRGQFETWFLDLMAEIDKNYRTMGPSDIDWTE